LWWVEPGCKKSSSPQSESGWAHLVFDSARGESTHVSQVGSL